MIKIRRRFCALLLTLGLGTSLFSVDTFTALATESTARQTDQSTGQETAAQDGEPEADASQPVSWPQGPQVAAEAAILMEANTGTILYAKNIHEQHFPASTTKIMTALIAMEESDMDEMVAYSSEAVNSINWREDSNIGIKAGESITMEQSLYGLMVGSGNECGNAIGEHISGSIDAFVVKMNERAKELGCTDTHFVTTNGIHDDAHYTSAHDLALIAQQYFSHDLLCKMSNTLDYVIPASDTLSQKLIPYTKNKLLAGRQYAYEGLVGSKTGYTSIAQQNLVSCAERDGMKLVCVVMKDSSPNQFTDTVDLFNFGFSNFKVVNVSENDTRYTVSTGGFFDSAQDIFGNSAPLLSMDKEAYVILPKDASLEDTQSTLSYDDLEKGQAAMVSYTYNGEPVGQAAILLSTTVNSFDFDKDVTDQTESSTLGMSKDAAESDVSDTADSIDPDAAPAASDTVSDTPSETAVNSSQENTVFLNVNTILFSLVGAAALIILILVIISAIRNRNLAKRRKAIMKRRRERNREIIDFDKYTNSMHD